MFIEDLERSFKPASDGGYWSYLVRTTPGHAVSPPYTIASVAQRRVVSDAQLELPDGYDDTKLQHIQDKSGWEGSSARFTPQEGEELASIGKQILALAEAGQIQPPLDMYEFRGIRRLIEVVGQAAVQ